MARRKSEEEPVVVEVVCLKYTGGSTGDAYIVGTPTTDLHEVPAEEATALVGSGLYEIIPGCSHGEQADSGD